MREIKFKAFHKETLVMHEVAFMNFSDSPRARVGLMNGGTVWREKLEILQYTGLTDRLGKDIYELCELNNRYILTYIAPCFVLYDIASGDIIEFDAQNEYEITREYKSLPKNAQRHIDQYVSQTDGAKQNA